MDVYFALVCALSVIALMVSGALVYILTASALPKWADRAIYSFMRRHVAGKVSRLKDEGYIP